VFREQLFRKPLLHSGLKRQREGILSFLEPRELKWPKRCCPAGVVVTEIGPGIKRVRGKSAVMSLSYHLPISCSLLPIVNSTEVNQQSTRMMQPKEL
jgi:hypothetical protein